MNVDYIIRTKLTIANEFYLTQYLSLIAHNNTIGYCEDHHILPQALWPEYKSKTKHPQNIVTLSLRDHLLAHYYFSKATNTLWNAIPAIAHATANGARVLQEHDLDLIELTMREYKENCRGENHHRYGITHSDETKRKISQANTGNTWTAERKQQHADKVRGYTHSEESKQKIRDARTGSTHSEATKQLLSEQRTGRKLTDEWKQNISTALTGKSKAPCSQERKAQMSKDRVGDGNPMYGRKQSEETKNKMRLKKLEQRKKKWGKLYYELYDMWVKADKCSAYKFAQWLKQNTEHEYTSGKLCGLVADFESISNTPVND